MPKNRVFGRSEGGGGGVITLLLVSYHLNNPWNAWYNCAFLLILAFCIFEMLSRKKKIFFVRIWKSLAKCSFGMYFVHYPLLMLITKWHRVELVSMEFIVVYILVVLISWGIVRVTGMIPVLNRILFFMK